MGSFKIKVNGHDYTVSNYNPDKDKLRRIVEGRDKIGVSKHEWSYLDGMASHMSKASKAKKKSKKTASGYGQWSSI